MTEMRPEIYHQHQRFAHWLVVLLVAIQLLSGSAMGEAYMAASRTGVWPPSGAATLHAWAGFAILGLMLWRVILRRRHGAPPPSQELSPALQWISRANHLAFYLVLIAMPIVGAIAAYTMNDGLALLHSGTAPVLFLLIIAHVMGAMWHATNPGSQVLRRMFRSREVGPH